MISESLIKKWHMGNDNGEGYPIGDEDMTPLEAAEYDDLAVIDDDCYGNVVAAYDETHLVVIRDHNGPWAVTVSVG